MRVRNSKKPIIYCVFREMNELSLSSRCTLKLKTTSYLHDLGPDSPQHVLQALRDANIGAAVHVTVHWNDLTWKQPL